MSRSTPDGQWHSFGSGNRVASNAPRGAGRSAASGSGSANSMAGRSAGNSTMATRSGGAAAGTSAARNASMNSSRSSGNAVSRATALSGMEHTRFNGSALSGSRFASSHSTTTTSRFGTPFASHVGTTSHRGAFAGSGFGRGFGRDRFDHDRFGRCFGCGFGFGFGWGFGFGFGGWWGPWGLWGPGWGWGWGWDPYWYDPWWPGYVYAPAPYPYPTDPIYSDNVRPRSNSSTSSVYGDDNPAMGDYDPASPSRDSYNRNSNPPTGNVALSTPTVLIYLKDGTTFAASDYWIADGKLHYYVNYSGESTVDMDQLDVQRTVDENSKRNVQFTLKPKPNRWNPEPSTSDKGTAEAAPATPSKESDDKSNAVPATTPAPAPAPPPKAQETSGSQT